MNRHQKEIDKQQVEKKWGRKKGFVWIIIGLDSNETKDFEFINKNKNA